MAEVQKVVVQIEADTDKATAEVNTFKKAIEDGIGDALKEAGVSAEQFEDGIKSLTKTGTEGFKSLRSQIKAAKEEAQILSQKFGDTSKEALNAQKKVANLTEELDDFNQRVKALNPEAKFNAASNAIQGMIGGLQGVTGALQLFGAESEEVEKIAMKMQGALNLAQGINSVIGLKDAFGNLRASLGLASIAQNGLNAAMAANPAGAIALAIGTLVTAVVLLNQKTEEYALSEEQLNQIKKSGIDATDDLRDAEDALAIQRDKNATFDIQRRKAKEQLEKDLFQLFLNQKNAQDELNEATAKYNELGVGAARDLVQERTERLRLAIQLKKETDQAIEDKQKEFSAISELIRLRELEAKSAKDSSKEKKEDSEQSIKLIQGLGIEAIKTKDDLLKLSTEGFNKLLDVLEIIEASPLEVKKNIEKLKEELDGLEPIMTKIMSTGDADMWRNVNAQVKDINRDILTNSLTVFDNLLDQQAQVRIQKLEEEKKAGLITEEKYAKEVGKIRRRQALQDRALAIFNIALNTSEAIMKVTAQLGTFAPPLIAAYTALGAAQIAAILSQPLPKFKKGTLNVGGGNLDADGGMHAIIHKGEAIIPKDRNRAYHPTIAAIYNKRISPHEINRFVEARTKGRKEPLTATINSNDLYRLKPSDSVNIRNTSILARKIGAEIASNINLRRQ